MTLQQLAYLIAQVLTGQITLMAAIKRINDQLAGNATEATAQAILTEAVSTDLVVTNGTTGLVNAYNQARTDTASILAAIAAITPTPAAPPPTAAENALAVWTRQDPNSPGGTGLYGDEQYEPYARAIAMNQGGAVDVAASMHFTGYGYFGSVHAPAELNDPPLPDWNAILASDTRLSWLTRTEARFTWTEDPGTHIITGFRTIGTGTVSFTFDLSEAEFRQLVGLPSGAAPVWPGLAGVTLGTPVALADELVVTGPLQGVLVDVTVPPAGGGVWSVGSRSVFYNWGQVSFDTDGGELEAFQWLGAGLGLYMPRQMAAAAHARFRVSRAATATVTPFTIP